jgi:hypothetical protein
MKSKISVYLSEHVAESLEAAAKRPGATKSSIVEAALDRYLTPAGEATDNVMILRCLSSISSRLDHLDRGLKIVSETVALHARYHFTVTPALPIEEQGAACVLGRERFEVLAAQVGKRVERGTPLMQETIELLNARGPDFFARDREEGVRRRGSHFADLEPDSTASIVVTEEPELAAAREGGSNGGFRGGRPRSSR